MECCGCIDKNFTQDSFMIRLVNRKIYERGTFCTWCGVTIKPFTYGERKKNNFKYTGLYGKILKYMKGSLLCSPLPRKELT